jgi:Mrp family chromosome partitioning ATPase
MLNLLEELQKKCDYVFVDAPPVLAASDAISMAPMMDGVILIARMGEANRESAKRTIELLKKVNARILGLVISFEAGSRYDLSTYDYYSYANGSEKRGSWFRRKKRAV